MNQKKEYYNKYSEYLNTKYSEKIYKLPINLPITCPNRTDGHGCTFCAEVGTGFEALPSNISVTQQLEKTKLHIEKKYNAHKFIAYFQNYTNTYMPIKAFLNYMTEAASYPDIVAISVSTRPDCISADYLEILKSIKEQYHIDINIELGLQTVNYHTLSKINRGHGLAEFIDAVLQIQRYDFSICCHIILNLPYDSMEDTIETAKIISALHIDIVKIHSLYIAKNTLLCEAYENGTITMCSKEEYIHRLINFLEFLDPKIIIERLFSRIPESEAVFSNWGTSWWKLQDLLIETMEKKKSYQGKKFCYLNGKALKDLT